jgi:hypothetical protein
MDPANENQSVDSSFTPVFSGETLPDFFSPCFIFPYLKNYAERTAVPSMDLLKRALLKIKSPA